MKKTLTCFALLGSVACGASVAPKELVDARAAYKTAQAGPARQLAPASLDDARQALEKAERSFESSDDSPETRDLSYVAIRRAQIAHAVGGQAEAKQQVAQAEKDRLTVQEQLTGEAQASLEKTKDQLEKEKLSAEREKERAAMREKELKAETAKTKAELAKERAARKALEGKYLAALASLKEMAKVKEEKRGVVITLNGAVLFATGKHELLPIAKTKLSEVAKALKDQGYKKITVEGHTDSRGSAENNRELSLKRANSVRAHLISQGLKGSKIKAVGIGEDRPVASNKSAEGRANNRRVELIVVPE